LPDSWKNSWKKKANAEVFDALIALRDSCADEGLKRTENAIQTALNIAFFEVGLQSGEVELSTQIVEY